MGRWYYEDARWPWRVDGSLRRFLGKQKRRQSHREHRERPRALDLGMGYGRNAVWLAEKGYAVEGWEKDGRYVAEARRQARLRGVRLVCRRGDFTRARLTGPYDVILIGGVLHMMRRSTALRVLGQARQALARRGLLFLLVKVSDDPFFRKLQSDPNWKPVRGERNTLRHQRGTLRGPRGRALSRVQSRLEPREVQRALRGLRVRHNRRVVLQSMWDGETGVRHCMVEVVAERA